MVDNEEIEYSELSLIIVPMRNIVEEADSIQDLLKSLGPLMSVAQYFAADFRHIFEGNHPYIYMRRGRPRSGLLIGSLRDPYFYW